VQHLQYALTSFFVWCVKNNLFTLKPAEGSNEFLKLLKSHKEKLEEGMKVLRRRNEELEKEKAESEKERVNLLATVEQLHSKLTQVEHFISACLLLQLDVSYGQMTSNMSNPFSGIYIV